MLELLDCSMDDATKRKDQKGQGSGRRGRTVEAWESLMGGGDLLYLTVVWYVSRASSTFATRRKEKDAKSSTEVAGERARRVCVRKKERCMYVDPRG